MNLKKSVPWANSPNWISGGERLDKSRDDKRGVEEEGIREQRVMWGWKGGESGKLGDCGKVVVVRRERDVLGE